MKITQVSNLHFQLTQLGLMNAYLVVEDDGFTLIDTCMRQANPIQQAAESLGTTIRRITLTHSHADHAGSVDALMKLVPDAELSLSQREARLFAGDQSLDPAEPNLKLRGDYLRSPAIPGRLLNDGDRLGSLRVIASPGHTPGHIAFLDERDGTLFAGDAYSVAGGIAVAGDLRPMFPFPALATWSPVLAIESAERLIGLSPARLCAGHGRVIVNPVDAMKNALHRAASRATVRASLAA
jgi:glyoxylase-like metal-dependent hydrolase (beta-lactamase superfamily II)